MKETPEIDDFDSILVDLKTGKWQYFQFMSTVLGIFAAPCFVYAGAFLAPTIDFTCVVPDGDYIKKDECTLIRNSTSPPVEVKCTEFIYSNETFGPTLTSEFNLVCDDAYYRSLFQTIYMLMGLTSGSFNGIIADKFGRRTYIFGAAFSSLIFQIIPTFVPNFTVMLICRGFLGILPSTLFLNAFNWSMEVCEPKKRSFYGVVLSIPWALGFMWFGVLGYFIRDWVWLQRAGALPYILVLINLWLIDESPRWLIVNGLHDEAMKTLRRAEKYNNVTLPPEDHLRKQLKLIQNREVQKSRSGANSVKDYWNLLVKAMKSHELRKRAFLVGVNFFCCFCVYEGLSLNAINFDLDPFLYMIQGGAAEVPSYILMAPVIGRWGRTRPSMVLQVLCGITILALTVLPSELKWLVSSLAMLGKFCISSAFQITFLIASELIPTEVKLIVWCTVYSLSKSGAVGASFLTGLVDESMKWLPATIFGGFSFVAAIILIFTPESLNRSIPDTIASIERSNSSRDAPKEEMNENTRV